jgi:hypothetical protein
MLEHRQKWRGTERRLVPVNFNLPRDVKKVYLMVDMKDSLERFVGKKFGKLTVKSFSHRNKASQSHWICQCSCGSPEKIVRGNHLLNNKIRSCGCSQRGVNNVRWKGFGEIGGWTWNNYKIGAKRRGIVFEVSVKDIWEQFLKQNRQCALTGEELFFGQMNQCNRKLVTASLDRIDSGQGYIKGNIQWIHKDLNRMKGDMSEEKFVDWCGRVSGYRN